MQPVTSKFWTCFAINKEKFVNRRYLIFGAIAVVVAVVVIVLVLNEDTSNEESSDDEDTTAAVDSDTADNDESPDIPAEEETATLAATAEITPEITLETTPDDDGEVVFAEATPDATAEVTPEVTEDASEDFALISVSADNAYYIAVSYALSDDALSPNLPAPEPTNRWIMLTATLANQAGDPITVEQGDLALVDTRGNRYLPEPPDEFTQPALVGAELVEGESIYGQVLFSVPQDTYLKLLEWCLDESCNEVIRSSIP